MQDNEKGHRREEKTRTWGGYRKQGGREEGEKSGRHAGRRTRNGRLRKGGRRKRRGGKEWQTRVEANKE